MKPLHFVLFAVCAFACAAGGGGSGETIATRAELHPQRWEPVELRVLESLPPKFVLVFARDMPTPGYRFQVDGIEVDAAAGRIVARVSELAPSGMVAQVIRPAKLQLELGTLPVGRYVVELRTRRGTDGAHRPSGAAVIVASGPRRQGS